MAETQGRGQSLIFTGNAAQKSSPECLCLSRTKLYGHNDKQLPCFPWIIEKWNVCLVAQLCPTLWDPMDCSPPGSSVHGILQARILEWVAKSSSRASFQPRNQTQVSCIANRFLGSDPPGKLEKWNIACRISKQGCHSYRWLQPSNMSWWALRALRKEKNTCPQGGLACCDSWGCKELDATERLNWLKIHQAAVTPYSEPQGSSGCETQDTGSIAEMHTKGVTSVSSDSCIFPGCCFVLVWFSRLVLTDSLWPHGLMQAHQDLLSMAFSGKNTVVGCHFPLHTMHRKALNSLTWDIWFSFFANNLLMFRLPALCCKTSI